MKIQQLHKWNLTIKEAVELQNKLAKKILIQPLKSQVELIAGCDVAFKKNSNEATAGITILSFPELKLLSRIVVNTKVKFPYIPGFLSFREIPVLLKAFVKLNDKIDLLFVDGYGIAHPRKFGIASHLGILLDLPTIGCGKTYLLGDYKLPDLEAGSFTKLTYKDEIVGAVVRTKTGVKPIFASIGNRINLEQTIEFTIKSCKGYRIPEPIRQAHLLVNTIVKQQEKS